MLPDLLRVLLAMLVDFGSDFLILIDKPHADGGADVVDAVDADDDGMLLELALTLGFACRAAWG